MRRLRFLPAAAAFAVAISCAFQSSLAGAATIPHTFRFATAEEVATLNPNINSQLVVLWLSQMTAAYAFRLDHENRLIPELATVIPTQKNGGISADGKTITLHLRSGVKWSDGAVFDADDVTFTIAAMNNSANIVPSRQGFDQITKIDEPDKHTIVVHLKAPYGSIVSVLFASNGGVAILPKHILGSLPDMNNAPFNGLPVGIGPFRYAAWKRGEQIELERNPYYWRGRPALERVILKLIPDRNTVLTELQTGELDMWYPFGGVFLPRVQAIPAVHLIRQPGYVVNEIVLNTKSPVLADHAVRVALRFGIDRRELRDKVGHGVGILQNVVLPTKDPSTPKDVSLTPFDTARANAILEAAGWKRGADGVREKNGTRLTIDVASSAGTPDADTIIEVIRSTWKAIGVEINVQRYQSSMLFAPYDQGGILQNGKFGAMFLGLDLPAPFDLTNSFGCRQIPPAGQNVSRFCDPKIDAILAQYDRTYDDATRAALISRVMHIVDDEALIIVTNGREDLFGVSDAVRNFTPNAATPFDDMLRVDVVP